MAQMLNISHCEKQIFVIIKDASVDGRTGERNMNKYTANAKGRTTCKITYIFDIDLYTSSIYILRFETLNSQHVQFTFSKIE